MNDSIIFLLLGWLLALLSPIVVDAIRKRRRVGQATVTIRTELTEVRLKLVSTAFLIVNRAGTLDRRFLEWMQPIHENYSGPHRNKGISEMLNRFLASSDEELATMADINMKKHSLRGLTVKKIQTPFLDTQLGLTRLLGVEIQNLLIEIKAQIGLLNEQVESSQFYFEKTFDSTLSDENHKIIRVNLKDTYINICERAQDVANLITKFLHNLKR